MSESTSTNVNELLEQATDEGILSPASLNAINVPNIGAQIQAGMGVNVDAVTAPDPTLVTIIVDDSGSISASGNTEVIRDGLNMVLDELSKAKTSDGILVHIRLLNGDIICPFCPLSEAVVNYRLDNKNYNEAKFLGTPLYDQVMVLLATVMAKTQEFSDNGVQVKTVTLIMSDGEDVHSRQNDENDCKRVITDMVKQEIHIVSGFGVPSYGSGNDDFRDIFESMGIAPQWILSPDMGATQEENGKIIRAALKLFSQSAISVSQTAATSFSQSTLGGFGNN